MKRSGKGLPPYCASYITGSDHRRQVEATETRQKKHKVVKQRRRLDRKLIQDEELPDDVRPATKTHKHHTFRRDKTRQTPT